MNVLIVEDNPISAKVLEHTLDKYGHETILAHDGKQAIDELESHPEIGLVITDIVMPKVDGIRLVASIKDRPEWSELPILVCTSRSPEYVNQAIPEQGWRYLFKPIRADSLMQKVNEALAKQKPVLQNTHRTMAQIGMDPQAFGEILDDFAKVTSKKIALLEQHINDHSPEPLALDDLMEGARLLRAERVRDILTRLRCVADATDAAGAAASRKLYLLLLRELKAMQHYLTIYAS